MVLIDTYFTVSGAAYHFVCSGSFRYPVLPLACSSILYIFYLVVYHFMIGNVYVSCI